MLKRLNIKGYKSFKDFRTSLQPLMVFFGPSSAGKTNLLDALHLLSGVVSSESLDKAFKGHRGFPLESCYSGKSIIKESRKKLKNRFTFQIDVEISDEVRRTVEGLVRAKRKGVTSKKDHRKWIVSDRYLRYKIFLEILPDKGYVRVIDERLVTIKKNGTEKKRHPFLNRDGKNLLLRMESPSHPLSYNIGLDRALVSSDFYEPHYPHLTAFRMELNNWKKYTLDNRALAKSASRATQTVQISTNGYNLATFLFSLREKSKGDFAKFNKDLKKFTSRDISVDFSEAPGGRIELAVRENGHVYSPRVISGSILKLIGYLAVLHPKNTATTLLFDEPETGIHPSNYGKLCELMEDFADDNRKQVIICTHSPVFVENFSDTNLFIVGKKDNSTDLHPFSTPGPVFRRQSIFKALESGDSEPDK